MNPLKWNATINSIAKKCVCLWGATIKAMGLGSSDFMSGLRFQSLRDGADGT